MPKTSKQDSESRKRLVLLDSHAILHRAYHALPDFATSKGEPTGALYGLSTMLISIIEQLKPDYIVACYDVKGPTYRHEAYKDYKAGRAKTEDDLIAQIIRSRDVFAALNIPIYDKEGFEADDMLGTIVEQVTKQGERRKEKGGKTDSTLLPASFSNLDIIIASGDMDTLQLVDDKRVRVYTLKKGIKDTIMYDEDAVKARFNFGPELIPDYKGLRGDPSDNIIGVKGIGEKTATTLITNFGTIEEMYKALEKKGGEEKFIAAGITPRIVELLKTNKEEAEFSKMLATIRRDAPITFALPEKPFKETLDVKKANQFWNDLEFRTLSQRLQKAIDGKSSVLPNGSMQEGESRKEEGERGDTSKATVATMKDRAHAKSDARVGKGATHMQSGLFSSISTEDFEKTAVALWLVNSNYTNPTLEDMYTFANTEDFSQAQKTIFTELDKRGVRTVYETIELPLMPIIGRMEKVGVKIDKKFLVDLSKTYHKELSRLEKKIHELAGMEFNINSPKQLGEVIFDKLELVGKNMKKTEGGARSTRESELEKLRDKHPMIPFLFEYRELQKLLSTYIDAIPPLLDEHDRLHTHFIQTGASTGRMASQNPGIQNIPIKTALGKAIRTAFTSEKGKVLVGLDYSQMELRIAAFMSKDEKLIDIFKKGEDVHTAVASSVFKVPSGEVTAEMRRRAKVINFGIIYGMGVLALKQNLGTSRDEAQTFMNDYFSTFSTLAAYLDGVKAEAARRGYTETFFGRRRYFEGIHSKIPYIRAAAERMAINAPIQGTGADVVKLAMIHIDKFISDKKLEHIIAPLLQVHDELIYEVDEKEAPKIVKELEKIMESVINPQDIHGVILKASSGIAKNWGELK